MSRKILWLLLFILVIAAFYFYTNREDKLVSPVLGVGLSIGNNVWFPKDGFFQKDQPEVTAKAAFFIDTQTGEVLYEKSSREKLPIASLNKIMTVVVALENKGFKEQFLISQRSADMEPDKMLLKAGERLNLEELLGGIFLVSANDAAEALAEGSTGRREDLPAGREDLPAGRQEFINLMNSKATHLGMKDTFFVNPTGLEEDQKQFSTAYDVALMSRYLIRKWPKILEISSNPHIIIPQTPDHQDYDLYSGINLITTYPGVLGLKTGYTPEAGLTLVTVARREGKEILGVLLGSTARRDDAKALLDYSFKKLGVIIK